MKRLKGEKLATGVIVLEWLMTVAQSIGLIVYLKYLGDYPEASADINLNPTTLLVWTSLGAIATIILFIFLSILLKMGITQKCSRHLSIWIMIQYVLFVLTFIIIVANVIGYLNWGWFGIVLIVSLVYRFIILKVISDFNHALDVERDKERRRSVMDLRQSEVGSTISGSPPAKLTQNNLHFHNSQYIPLPTQSNSQHYTAPEYNTRPIQPIYATPTPSYVPPDIQPVSTISVSQTYHPRQQPQVLPQFRSNAPVTRSFSESTV